MNSAALPDPGGPLRISHSNRFRYYSPELGRYISADPIGQSGGANVYRYARNNPLSWFDPFGLDVRYRGASLSNPRTRAQVEEIDRAFPDHDVEVTGGDRYRDETGMARETADNTPIADSAPDSSHFGGTGVDFHLEGPNLPSTQAIEKAARDAGFDNYVTSNYPDRHTHADYRETFICDPTIGILPICESPPPNSCEAD